jgi:enoyl-CoA hydratase
MADVEVEVAERVATLTLARPPVNALSSAMYRALLAALEDLAGRQEVLVVVLASSSPKAFCAGADVTELAALTGEAAREADAARQQLARAVFDHLLDLPQPTIAALAGPAIGAGAVIASCCDLRVAGPGATFQLPEIDVGRCGGARHLMRHLPQNVVRRMYFTGRPLHAEAAARFGFVDLTPEGVDPLANALETAAELAAKSPAALRLGKEALNGSESLPVKVGYALEQEYTLRLARTADAREALAARAERRPPVFTGQ